MTLCAGRPGASGLGRGLRSNARSLTGCPMELSDLLRRFVEVLEGLGISVSRHGVCRDDDLRRSSFHERYRRGGRVPPPGSGGPVLSLLPVRQSFTATVRLSWRRSRQRLQFNIIHFRIGHQDRRVHSRAEPIQSRFSVSRRTAHTGTWIRRPFRLARS